VSITITDPVLAEAFRSAAAGSEIRDAAGVLLGVWPGAVVGTVPPGVQSPFSDEEMAHRRRNPVPGRPLADVLRHLEARG
jgi:hypothetical protein